MTVVEGTLRLNLEHDAVRSFQEYGRAVGPAIRQVKLLGEQLKSMGNIERELVRINNRAVQERIASIQREKQAIESRNASLAARGRRRRAGIAAGDPGLFAGAGGFGRAAAGAIGGLGAISLGLGAARDLGATNQEGQPTSRNRGIGTLIGGGIGLGLGLIGGGVTAALTAPAGGAIGGEIGAFFDRNQEKERTEARASEKLAKEQEKTREELRRLGEAIKSLGQLQTVPGQGSTALSNAIERLVTRLETEQATGERVDLDPVEQAQAGRDAGIIGRAARAQALIEAMNRLEITTGEAAKINKQQSLNLPIDIFFKSDRQRSGRSVAPGTNLF